jgi:hypothetical protein
MITDEQLEAQVEVVLAALDRLAESLAADGHLQASGVALTGLQAIRALWTRLHPPVAQPPELKSVPPEPVPPTVEASGR